MKFLIIIIFPIFLYGQEWTYYKTIKATETSEHVEIYYDKEFETVGKYLLVIDILIYYHTPQVYKGEHYNNQECKYIVNIQKETYSICKVGYFLNRKTVEEVALEEDELEDHVFNEAGNLQDLLRQVYEDFHSSK